MKINNNLFKGDKSGAAKGMMLGAATGGVVGTAAGGTIGYYLGKEVKNIELEKMANKMGITIIDDHAPDIISYKEVLEKGGIWYKKDDVIFTIGDHPWGLECNTKTLENCYMYTFTPEDLLANDYKNLIKNYTIKGTVVGALTGTFIGSLVGAAIGVLVGSDEDKGKRG